MTLGPLLGTRLDPVQPDVAARLRDWVRAVVDLTDDVAVTVTQLSCRDSDCAQVETVLAVLHPGAPLSRVLALPAAQVCAADVLRAFDAGRGPMGRAPRMLPGHDGQVSALARPARRDATGRSVRRLSW